MIAGPSEVLVLADSSAKIDYVAADMIAQAEHDVDASAICVTSSIKFAKSLLSEINIQSQLLPRRDIINKSLIRNGAVYVVKNLKECISFANIFAPEHLEVFTVNPDEISTKIVNAGSIFVGEGSAEAFGDYIAGPSHVLPTNGASKNSSGLSVYNFLKKISSINSNQRTIKTLGPSAKIIAECEGLDAHAKSIQARIDGK